MLIRGLFEAILYVKDMNTQVQFYREMLELPLLFPPDLQDYSREHWVTFDTGACTLALHSGGQGRTGEDASELTYLVGDLGAARQTLIERGVAMGDIRTAAPGISVCPGCDPEGNRFSLEERQSLGDHRSL